MARPKKEAGKARDKLMQVRVQATEYDAFREAAESAGLDLSSWVRERLKRLAAQEMRAQQKTAAVGQRSA